MKILIVSDTHGRHKALDSLLDKIGPIDMFIHLGDVEGGEDYIQTILDCEAHIVKGNNDFFSDLPREEELFIGKYKAFITHGHNYYVSMDPERIKEEGRSRQADVVMFGHTHKPYLDIDTDIVVLNPGSLCYPRQEGRRGTYAIMEIDKNGKFHFTHNVI